MLLVEFTPATGANTKGAMIICLEGPSAVGKTSTCQALANRMGAVIVPEVNALFSRPNPEPEYWYLQRRVKRWDLACQASAKNSLAVLDGDPFQPFWYNWSFGFDGYQGMDHLSTFFRPLVASGHLQYPDRYFLLSARRSGIKTTKGRRCEPKPGKFRAPFAINRNATALLRCNVAIRSASSQHHSNSDDRR